MARIIPQEERRNDKVKLGDRLETDNHIISVAYTLAHESPVLIITRDREMERRATNMGLILNSERGRKKYGVEEAPTNQIETTNLYLNMPRMVYLPNIK